MNIIDASTWSADWLWSLPLIVANIVIHVFGLVFINDAVVIMLKNIAGRRRFMTRFTQVMGVAVLLIVLLHATEALTWAVVYQMLGALPDYKMAMLYSLSAMTTYGHANIFLHPQWQMMGALQSLNGVLLLGLTTAFLFTMIHSVWSSRGDKPQRTRLKR